MQRVTLLSEKKERENYKVFPQNVHINYLILNYYLLHLAHNSVINKTRLLSLIATFYI